MPAPVASGWSESPGGPCTHWEKRRLVTAHMDRQTLRDWVHRYNEAGIAGLSNRPAPGRSPKLTEGQMAALKAVVLAAPDPEVDGVVRSEIDGAHPEAERFEIWSKDEARVGQ